MKYIILLFIATNISVIAKAQFKTLKYISEQKVDSVKNIIDTTSLQKDTVKKEKPTSLYLIKRQRSIIKMSTKYDSLLLHKKILNLEEDIKNIKSKNIKNRQNFYMPLKRIVVTSKYGNRFHPIKKKYEKHNGVDLKASSDNVYAIKDGKVVDSGFTNLNGNYIVLKHNDILSYYLHLSNVYYKKGEHVKAGYIIGKTGNTGSSTGEHLHFAIKQNQQYIDPIKYLYNLIKPKI